MAAQTENQDFIAYRDRGSIPALARVFDGVAPQLLLLAMHVTPDASEAEDLVQSTFLRAMEDAYRYDGVRPVAGWLSGILKNLAIDRLRRNRLRKSECLPPDLKDGPSPATIVADQDLWDRVTEEIHSLSNPYREVLALRIVNGLEPAEIAHSLGRSPSTVRMQLKRGLDKLRQTLPAELTCLGAWVLLPTKGLQTIKSEVISQASGAAGSTTGGGSTFGSTWSHLLGSIATMKIVAAAVFMILGLLAFWSQSSEEQIASSSAMGPVAGQLETLDPHGQTASAQPLQGGSTEAQERRKGLPPSTELTTVAAVSNLEIHVIYEADNSPAAGVGIYIRPVNGNTLGFETRTNAHGVVSFPGLESVWHALNVDRLQGAIRIFPPDQEKLEVRIPVGVTLEGRVIDLNGQGVGGSRIYRLNRSHHDALQVVTTSDKNGHFTLRHAEESTEYLARAKGWQPSELKRLRGTRYFELVLGAKGHSLKGSVTGPQGQPVPFAWLAIGTDEDSRESTEGSQQAPGDAKRSKYMDLEGLLLRADASGFFECNEVPAGFVLIVARGPGTQSTLIGTHHYWHGFGLEEQVQLTLHPGAQAFGVIKDVTGRPIPHMKIEAQWEGLPELGSFDHDMGGFVGDRFSISNERGEYRVTGLFAGDVDLRVQGKRRKLLRSETHITIGQQFRWDPVIDEIASLRIVLTDHSNLPLVGWALQVTNAPEGHIDGSFWSHFTNALGELTIFDLEPNKTYTVRLYAPLENGSFCATPSALRKNIRIDQGVLRIALTYDELPEQETK